MNSSGSEEVRAAVRRVVGQLERPLADTWGCSLRGHVAALAERLGAVQRISEGGPECHEEIVEQLAELAASAVVMLVEASRIFSSTTNGSRRCTMNASATARAALNVDDVLVGPRGIGSDRLTDDDSDVILVDARGRQVNPLRTTMTAAEALDDSLGPCR